MKHCEIQWIVLLLFVFFILLALFTCMEPMKPLYNDTTIDQQLIETSRVTKVHTSPSEHVPSERISRPMMVE